MPQTSVPDTCLDMDSISSKERSMSVNSPQRTQTLWVQWDRRNLKMAALT